MSDSAGGSPVLRGIFWAATWGVGAAIGVALGGWLTVVGGGASAPGPESLDVTEDLLLLPLLAGGVVFAVHLIGQIVIALVRRARSA